MMNNIIVPRPANHSFYSYEENRLSSFKHWPPAMPLKAWDLARAGFFYLGKFDN